MIITVPSELEPKLKENAQHANLSVDSYVERLIRLDLLWHEPQPSQPEEIDPEFSEIRSSII